MPLRPLGHERHDPPTTAVRARPRGRGHHRRGGGGRLRRQGRRPRHRRLEPPVRGVRVLRSPPAAQPLLQHPDGDGRHAALHPRRLAGVRDGGRRHVRRGDDHPAPGRREDRRRHPAGDRQPRRLRRHDRRRRRHQHGQGEPRLLGGRVRLWRRRDLLHHGREGRRRIGDRGRRPQRPEARGRQAVRRHALVQARRAGQPPGQPHRRRRVRLLVRGHRPADHDARRLRRHPSGRHGVHRRRRQARRVRAASRPSSSSSRRRTSSARTTGRPTSARTSTSSSGSGRTGSSTSTG